MTTYIAPVRDMHFVMRELAGLEQLSSLPGYEEVTPELAHAVLEEAARLAGEVLAPLNKIGDQRGASLTKDGVAAAEGFGAAYRQFVENGWNGLSGDPDYGGQGLPGLIAAATVEIWNSDGTRCPRGPREFAVGGGRDVLPRKDRHRHLLCRANHAQGKRTA